MDPILHKFGHIEWRYATGDSKALATLEERIAEAGRRRALITYSELVRGVTFNLPNVQKPRTIDITDWQELDRAIVGDFLNAPSVVFDETAVCAKPHQAIRVLCDGSHVIGGQTMKERNRAPLMEGRW